jgi:hypothetical protein
VTRSHKANDRDHVGLAEGTAAPSEHLPRYFAKHGHEGVDPKKMKKSGGGKGNWYDSPSSRSIFLAQFSINPPGLLMIMELLLTTHQQGLCR